MWEFSHEALKVRRGPLDLCVGTYGPLECSGEFLKPSYPFWLSFVRGSREISLGPSLHRPSTDGLIRIAV